MNIDIFKQNKAIEVKPFELSLWKDELVTKKATNKKNFLNIYPGLGTDENDLSFWYRTHNNSDAVITKINDEQIEIKIKEPEERENNLVHLDLSTSNLIFKPNTYYVFYTEIDFEDGKLPDLTNYIQYYQAHPTDEEKNSHIFFSLIRRDTPNSIWDMPHPIFDSSLIISVRQEVNGNIDFNLLQTYINEENGEKINLFVVNSNEDKPKPQKLYLIGRLKTNNFLQENYTLGMWTFFESWLGDSWEAKVNIKVMEEQSLENPQSSIYELLYNEIRGSNLEGSNSSSEIDYKTDMLIKLKEFLPNEGNYPFSSPNSFGAVQVSIEEQIKNYFQNRNTDFINCANLIQRINELKSEMLELTETINELESNISESNTSELDTLKLQADEIANEIEDFKRQVDDILKTYGYQYYNGDTEALEPTTKGNIKCELLNSKLLEILVKPFQGILNITIDDESNNSDTYYKFTDSITIGTDENENPTFPIIQDADIDTRLIGYWQQFFDSNKEIKNKIYFKLNAFFNNLYNQKEIPAPADAANRIKYIQNCLYCINTLMYVPYYKTIFLNNANTFLFDGILSTEFYRTRALRLEYSNIFLLEIFLRMFLGNDGKGIIKKFNLQIPGSTIKLLRSQSKEFMEQLGTFKSQDMCTAKVPKFGNLWENLGLSKAVFFEDLRTILLEKDIDILFYKKQEDIQYLKEIKYLIFGAPNGPKSFAQDIVLNLNTTNEMNNLTFSLFDLYYNEFGKLKKNPYIPLLQNESKIKLYYNNEWYDFIITEVDFNRIEEKYSYTAKDANAIELSKTGFNKTFNTELDNNVGTINELAKRVLEGSDWKLDEKNTETFIQYIKRPIFGGTLKTGLSITVNGSFYDDSLVKSTINDGITLTFSTGSYIYLFYNTEKGNNKPRIIVPAWDKEYRSGNLVNLTLKKEDYLIIDNTLTNVFLCDNYEIKYTMDPPENISFKTYSISDSNNIKIETIDIFTDPLDFDYSLRAKDIIISPKTHYSVPLKRYVTEYSPISNDNSTEVNNKILYGYSQSEYTTKPLVQNLLPNGKDFVSLDGWIVNDFGSHTFTSDLAMLEISDDYYINSQDKYRTALVLNTQRAYNSQNKPHGFLCNTEIGYNTAALQKLAPGDEFVLRVQFERGGDLKNASKTDNRLWLIEEMIPSLYFYNDTYTLQNTSDISVLPKKQNQVMLFLQDKRFREEGKYYSGLSELPSADVTLDNNGNILNTRKSTYDSQFADLETVMEDYGLVPIYYYHSGEKKISGIKYHYFAKSPLPCAYVPKLRAKKWEKSNYVKLLSETGWWSNTDTSGLRNTNNKKNNEYIFTNAGWNRFVTLFRSTGLDTDPQLSSSRFNFKDFSIIIYPNSKYTIKKNTDEQETVHPYTVDMEQLKKEHQNKIPTPQVGSFADSLVRSNWLFDNDGHQNINDISVKYYLPMLFTDKDLIEALTLTTEEEEYLKEELNHWFFRKEYRRNDSTIKWTWEDILSTKEYYIIEGKNDGTWGNAQPNNIDIIKAENPDEKVIEIDLDDFEHIIKMRAFWYLKQYSPSTVCIFETTGTFFGRTFLTDSSSQTLSYKKTLTGYTHEDLLSRNLGLFFTFGNLRTDIHIDPIVYGELSATLSNFQFFRKFTDENDNIYEPSEFIESNTTPIYKLYDPDKNKDVLKEEDMIYDYTDIKLTGYEPVLDLTGERKNSITITESNRYDLLQKLAEVFEGWLVIKAEHDENGAIALDENNKPKKKVSFINIKYNNNYMGVRYGANLKNLQRKIDSNDIVTKMIVKNNNNEFGENGFCSIARSKYNFSGSNSIFNIDYLIQTKILPRHIKDKLYNSIYLRTYNFGQAIKDFNTQRITQSTRVLQLEAEKEYYQQLLNAAVEKQTSFQDKFTAYSLPKGYSYYRSKLNKIISASDSTGVYHDDYVVINNVTTIQDVTATIIALDYYNYLIKNTRQKLRNVSSEMTTAKRQYNSYVDIVKSLTQQRDSLLQEFENLCQGYIREGAWTSEDYIDDDLYYFDGEKQLEEMSKPHVTYTIDVVDIPSLYNYKLRDKTFVEDPEVFGYDDKGRPAKEEILITGQSIHLQSPDKNTITVQNYRTSYDDLFQRIASTIQAVEYGTLNYPNKRIYNDIEIRTSNNETRTVTV